MNMVITHKKLQPMQCYHIFSDTSDVYLSKNANQMLLTNKTFFVKKQYTHVTSRIDNCLTGNTYIGTRVDRYSEHCA